MRGARRRRFAPAGRKHPGTDLGSLRQGRIATLPGRGALAAAKYRDCRVGLVVACQARLDPGAARAVRRSRPCIAAALKLGKWARTPDTDGAEHMKFGLFGGARSAGEGSVGDSLGYRKYVDYVLLAEQLGYHSVF